MTVGGVIDQRSPAAADVEQSLACAQVELPADQLELGVLRRIQRLVMAREVRARVRHAVVEPQGVEVVAHVVVGADCGHVPGRRVTLSGQCGHPPGRCRTPGGLGKLEAPACGPAGVGGPKSAQVDRISRLDRAPDVALDLQIAPDVGLAKRVRHGR